MTSWTDVVGAVGGLVGAATSVGVALWAVHRDRQQRTDQAASEERSNRRHEATATIAREAAESARRSADEAAKIAAIRLAEYHDANAPNIMTIETKLRKGSLFGTITVSRDFHVRAESVWQNSRWPLGLPRLLRAHQAQEFHIEHWPQDRQVPQVESIAFRFWPPAPAGEAEHWTCPCGRPLVFTTDDQPGHWEARVGIGPPENLNVR